MISETKLLRPVNTWQLAASALFAVALNQVACGPSPEPQTIKPLASPAPTPSTTAPPSSESLILPAPTLVRTTPPKSCSPAPPADLVRPIGNASAPISIATSDDPPAIWITSEGGSNVVLYEVGNAGAAKPVQHNLGTGFAQSGGLARMGASLVGVLLHQGANIFFKPLRGGPPQVVEIATKSELGNAAGAVVGERFLAAWDLNGSGMEYAWVAGASARPDVKPIGTKATLPAVAAAFGGAVFYVEPGPGGGRLMMALAADASTPVEIMSGAMALGMSAAGAADRAYVVYPVTDAPGGGAVGGSGIEMAVISDKSGKSKKVRLGAGSFPVESAVAAAPWGAVATWIGARGAITIAIVSKEGEQIGEPIVVSGSAERGRSPAIALSEDGSSIYVAWNQVGTPALRLDHVTCE